MKTSQLLVLMLSLFGVENACWAIQEKEKEPPVKLINQYGFENILAGKLPKGWTFSGRKGVAAKVAQSPSNSGKHCLKVVSLNEGFGRQPVGSVHFRWNPKQYLGKRVRFKASVKTSLGDDGKFTFWLLETLQSGETGIFDNMLDRPIIESDWDEKQIVVDLSKKSKIVNFGFLIFGKGEVLIDDVAIEIVDGSVQVTRPLPAAPRPMEFKSAPGLFEIKGSMEVRANLPKLKGQKNGGEAKLLIPLPLRYRDQYPVTYQLSVDPPESLTSMKIFEDRPGNFVTEVTLQQFTKLKKVKVDFSSLVMVAPSDFSNVPTEMSITKNWNQDAKKWLKTTWCADAGNLRIKRITSKIRQETDDILRIISKVEIEAKRLFGAATGKATCLTATVALDKKGTCTSRANLVAALLRASGVPARVLAGYPSWSGPLQTHYIVEAYIPTFGWYPIESTLYHSPWPNHRQINVSIVPPEYESEKLAGPRTGVVGGVPYLSLTEIRNNDNLFYCVGTIPGHPHRDHACQFVRKFEGSRKNWRLAAKKAEMRWKKWLASEQKIKDGRVHFGPSFSGTDSSSPKEFMVEVNGHS